MIKTEEAVLPPPGAKLLKVALDDMALIMKKDGYIMNAAKWHMPDKEGCHVCLAGAVIAGTLKVSQQTARTDNDFVFDTRTSLGWLESVRNGSSGIYDTDELLFLWNAGVFAYHNFYGHEQASKFIAGMRKIQKALEQIETA